MYVKDFNMKLEIVIVSNKIFQDTDWGIFKNNFRGFFENYLILQLLCIYKSAPVP